MLSNLPNELLIGIAMYLPIASKLQLILTCKKFKDVIYDRCFYDTLDLWDKRLPVETTLSRFKSEQSHGQKVKVLEIMLEDLHDKLFRELPIIFPNVTDIYDLSFEDDLLPEAYFKEFIRWKNSLKYLKVYESSVTVALCKMLENNVFSCLTNLTTSLIKTRRHRIDIWKCIKNAPALESLTLGSLEITLENMESIHSGCPLLSILKIHSCAILVNKSDVLPEEITPALRLSRLSLSGSAILDQQSLFLVYITRKYTNLVILGFDPGTPKNDLNDICLAYTSKTISSPYCDMRKNDQYLTHESYTTSASKILSNLPGTLKQLESTLFNIDAPITIFSKKCVNITRLELLRYICSSFEDIEMLKRHLPSLKQLTLWIDPSMQEHNQAPVWTSITHIKITIPGIPSQNKMNIGWILSMFPSLNSLDIAWSGVLLMGCQSDPPRVYPNLTKLLIGPSSIDNHFLNYMCMAAPNLKDISWPIFQVLIGKEMDGLELKSIDVFPNESKKLGDRKHYRIDVTDFYLDCFYLNIYTNLEDRFPERGIVLQLMKRNGKKTMFIILKDCLITCSTKWSLVFIKKQITIRYDDIKKIKINSKMFIDLEKSPIKYGIL